jgi:hypothetical protein
MRALVDNKYSCRELTCSEHDTVKVSLWRRFFRGLSATCAVLSLVVFIASCPLGFWSIFRSTNCNSTGESIEWFIVMAVCFLVSLGGSAVAIAGYLGKHKMKRISLFSFLGNLVLPIVIVVLYIILRLSN